MTGVRTLTVTAEDAGQRLDRWLKHQAPGVGHGMIQKWLRTGQVRVDGGRAKANVRLDAGQRVRVPPLPDTATLAKSAKSAPREISDSDAQSLRARVLHEDDAMIVIDKPEGLAVQGGSGQRRNLDDMLVALVPAGAEKPRLVHRLDKDTSGVLVLARSASTARHLTRAFRDKATRKIYWALVVGSPDPAEGRIDMALLKRTGAHGEQVMPDAAAGKPTRTDYRTIGGAGGRLSWLELQPLTGRTHQIRVHCAAGMGTPILGDGKYGGQGAFVGDTFKKCLHLHARAIEVPHPSGGVLRCVAPPPAHMLAAFAALGIDWSDEA